MVARQPAPARPAQPVHAPAVVEQVGVDPYDGNIRGRLRGIIADLAAILIRRNGPLMHVANVSRIPRIKTIKDESGCLSPCTLTLEEKGGTL